MLGLGKAKKADVLDHWYTLVDQFNIPCKDFYDAIERELTHRKVPDLTISRVMFSEGGLLTANREYLRMKRDWLVFDICAAPFGVSFFFSLRFAELPKGMRLWQWIAAFLGGLFFCAILGWLMGFIVAFFCFWLLIVVTVWLIFDAGKESYYRQDTRLMYHEVVTAVVKQKIAEFTSARGINLLSIKQHSPLMDDLYRTTQVSIQPIEQPAETPPEQVPQ